MAGEKTAPDTLGPLLNGANLLIPAIFGSGTTKTQVTSDPGAISSLHDIMTSANAAAEDDSATDAMVNNIMRQAAIQFAPTLGDEKTAGLYNSSTVAAMADQSKANATGAAAKAVLDYKTGQRTIAANAAGALANASRTQTSKTGPAVNPAVSGAIGGLMTAKSLFTNRKAIGDFINDPVGSGKKFMTDIFGESEGAGGGAGGAPTAFGTEAGPSGFGVGGQQSLSGATSPSFTSFSQLGSASSDVPLTSGLDAPDTSGIAIDAAGNPITDASGNVVTPSAVDDAADLTNGGSNLAVDPDAASSVDDAADLLSGGSDAVDAADSTAGVVDTASSIDDAADLYEAGDTIEAGSEAADGIEAATAASSATPWGLIVAAISQVSQAFGGPSAGEAFSAVNTGFKHFTSEDDTELSAVQQGGDQGLSSLFQGDLGGVVDSQTGMVENQINGFTSGDVLDNVTSTFDPSSVFDDIGDSIGSVGDSSVICTEAQKQGLLNVKLARKEMQLNLARLSDLTLKGYQWLAVPLVLKMRKDRRWALFLARQANVYCNEICFKSGGVTGKLFRFVGEPFCWLVGAGLLVSGKLGQVADMVQKELYRHG